MLLATHRALPAIGLILVSASPAVLAAAPSPFGGEEHYAVDEAFGDVAVADFDADGWVDVAAGEAGAIRLWLNDGAGVLLDGPRLEVGAGIVAVASADLDGDGRIDFAFARTEPAPHGEIGVILARAGGFDPPRRFVTSATPSDVELADLDGDGRLDLVVAGAQTLSVFHNDGGGVFGPGAGRSWIDELAAPHLRIADMNGDGRLDAVLTPGAHAAMAILPGRAVDGFGPPVDLAGFGPGTAAAPADLDHDGWMDVAVVTEAGIVIGWNDGSHSFAFPEHDPVGSPGCGTLLVADFDGDGMLDVLSGVSDDSDARLDWFRGASGRRFEQAPGPLLHRFGGLDPGGDPLALRAAADLDHDGASDVIMLRGSFALSLGVLRHALPEAFRGLNRLAMAPLATGRGRFFGANLSTPGRMELLQQGQDRLLHWTFAKGGRLRAPEDLAVAGEMAEVVDLDGDGTSDLLMRRGSDLEIVRIAGGVPAPVELWPDARFLALGRFDDRPGVDLLVRNGAGLHSLLLNDGGGRFSKVDIQGVAFTSVPGAGDLDGDGLDDILVNRDGPSFPGASPGDTIAVYANRGGGSFELDATIEMARDLITVAEIRVADLDRDGHPEILVLSGSHPAWLEVLDPANPVINDRSIRAWEDPRRLCVADFDRDGRLDVAFVSNQKGFDGRLTIGFSRPDGFAVEDRKIDFSSAQSLIAGDADGDGTVDLFAGLDTGLAEGATGAIMFSLLHVGPLAAEPVRATAGARLAIRGVSPNPARGDATLRLDAPAAGRVRIELFDVAGRRVQDETFTVAAAGEHTLRLSPRRDLPAGLYLVRAATGGRSAVGRLAIVR